MAGEVKMAAILIVDDDREMVSMLRDVLEAAGYRTAMAYSGAQALATVEREEPDLMITDLRMAGMNGSQLQKQVKRTAPSCPSSSSPPSVQSKPPSSRCGLVLLTTSPNRSATTSYCW